MRLIYPISPHHTPLFPSALPAGDRLSPGGKIWCVVRWSPPDALRHGNHPRDPTPREHRPTGSFPCHHQGHFTHGIPHPSGESLHRWGGWVYVTTPVESLTWGGRDTREGLQRQWCPTGCYFDQLCCNQSPLSENDSEPVYMNLKKMFMIVFSYLIIQAMYPP